MDAAQNAVGGGGRYDGLVASLGGPETPGIGFALGVDRSLIACDAEGVFPAEVPTVAVFVIDTTDGTAARTAVDQLRSAGISADRSWSQEFDASGSQQRSMKAQMKAANRSGAALALIYGTDEVEHHRVIVRDLRQSEQHEVHDAEMLKTVASLLQAPVEDSMQ